MASRVASAQTWFGDRGLPQVLPASQRARGLFRRAAPIFCALFVQDAWIQGVVALWTTVAGPEGTITGETGEIAFLALSALFVLATPVALLVGWLVWRHLKRSPGVGRILGPLSFVGWIAVSTVLSARFDGANWALALSGRIAGGLLVLLLLFLGAGALAWWALRRTFYELWSVGPMVVRVLPVLMLAVLFLFFNAEIWQVSAGLDWVRAFCVAAVLGALALIVIAVTATDELRSDIEEAQLREPAPTEELLIGTPLEGMTVTELAPRLSVGERINFFLVPIAAQAIQVAIFGALMFGFFVTFGKLAISDSVAKSWITTDPPPLLLFDVPLGVNEPLVKVSLILASFCALFFAASSSSDQRYRDAFLEPILRETRVNLAARHAYLDALEALGEREAAADGGTSSPEATPT